MGWAGIAKLIALVLALGLETFAVAAVIGLTGVSRPSGAGGRADGPVL
jgi:hypothetical protein